jgi:hypothetical protein
MLQVRNANWPLGLLGAVGGGALGVLAFYLLGRLGLYAIVLPGAMLGIGCGALLPDKSGAMGIICGLLGLLLGVFTEWCFAPFAVDRSLWFFVAHLNGLPNVKLVMFAVGGLFAFWFGRGREGGVWKAKREPPASTE